MNEENKKDTNATSNLGLAFGLIGALSTLFINPNEKSNEVKTLLEIAKLNNIEVTEEFFEKIINLIYNKQKELELPINISNILNKTSE